MVQINEATNYIQSIIGDFRPQFGIILGTGLGKLTTEIEVEYTINYEDIPHFPIATVEFHTGKLLFGKLKGKNVVCMQGRFHYYEGYSMQQVTFPVRVMKMLGIERLIVSNAAGGMNPSFSESDLMIIEDHIALFLPENPLVGPNIMGDRFPDMSEPYDLEMIEKAKLIATQNDIEGVHTGTYVSVSGPQLETKAEYKLLRMVGADAVGMSTVPEVIVARQMDLPVFGISVITDMCIPETLKKAEIEKILASAYRAEPNMTLIIKELIAGL
ncbi:purine nucleoside phosphorylase I, inosine and guanosine-specific [Emticicia oligotrophica DSM 17448]|uniref:Purine nucleoside phosphorylase n=1 Tax=Emticicia oligotrophica (strain DSM 17448 / CIP 109782 / MTCC 6937 / GPTSA100-15) TaxID=929562 RepID=A0ABM5MWI0_EMTOG|nr:purine-nucleoside phosphorylase [Emticicia oligotrophica]AFK01497.1 purine nucleoside phosphorylase I, inosine and guanosine-specific [Emticicia oligotrophica DSM 17448]